jgi:ribonuclease-3
LNDIIKGLDARSTKCKYHSSHGRTGGDILLKKNPIKDGIELTKPDVIVIKEDEMLFIEVELSNSPKRIIGDAATVDFSDIGKWGGEWHNLTKKSLLVVLNSESLDKEGSGKKKQMVGLWKMLQDSLGLTSISIVGNLDALHAIDDWLVSGRFTRSDLHKNEIIKRVELKLGYEFRDESLLIRSLTRKGNLNDEQDSMNEAGERTRGIFQSVVALKEMGNQEPLETIGDSAIDLAILNHCVLRNRFITPDELTTRAKQLSENKALVPVARKLKLQENVLWSHNEGDGAVKEWDKPGSETLADCFEAIIGAVYLDGGMRGVNNVLDNIHFFD